MNKEVKKKALVKDDEENLQFFTMSEIARILRVSPSTIKGEIDKGKLKSIRIASRIRISKKAFKEYCERQKNKFRI